MFCVVKSEYVMFTFGELSQIRIFFMLKTHTRNSNLTLTSDFSTNKLNLNLMGFIFRFIFRMNFAQEQLVE